jgi:two-component system sensor histidine kinase UhpB
MIFSNYIEVNDQIGTLLRYSREEILNHSIYDIIPIRDCQRIDQIIAQLIDDQNIVFEIDFISKDKRRIPVEINAHLFEYKNIPTVLSVVRDITKRSQAHKQLSKSREQLRKLALRLQTIREEERSVIAREIHDELGQLLTVLKIQISLISKKISKNQKSIHERIQSSIKFIDQAVDSVQKITTQLRPGILDELGLIPAIEWQAQEFENRTGIRCDCSLPKDSIDLLSEHSTALFRITQEALTNVARHSFAERVSIYLKKENSKLILEITDNGKGIHDYQINNPNSLGLLGIKERAMVFGGTVTINGVSHRGTNLKVEWPLKDDSVN